MSVQPPVPPSLGTASPATAAGAPPSLADGEWHRMHPLTPLFKGGLALIVIGGFLIANLRERLIAWIVDLFEPEARYDQYGGDPVDWVLSNNLAIVALLSVLGVVAVLMAIFWVIWRFQQFRITGDHVEVRKGIVFRSHRRAPLDRVQGVNLTRPFPARIIGLAKLEVVGAGTDANVELDYLATSKAEAVRADILRLASGARAARQGDAPASAAAQLSPRAQLRGEVNHGVTGMINGVDLGDVAPHSVVRIPTGRLIGSELIGTLVWVIFFGLIFLIAMGGVLIGAIFDGDAPRGALGIGLGFGIGVPMVIAIVGITWARISKSLRYSIAPTPDGVRITYGLLTTVTETLPPGRIFAVEVSQSLLWRPFGWWTIKINRMGGKSAAQQQSGNAQQFNIVLPVGKRADVERVLGLILPDAPASDIPLVWEHGILGPVAGDPYRTMPARAWWRRPVSWKRHGYALSGFGLLLRRGTIWRKLAIFPLARLQGVSLSQGPIDRAQRVSGAQVHSVQGPITGYLSGLERADALDLINGVSRAAVLAAAHDQTHRWGERGPDVGGQPPAPVAAAGYAMAPPPLGAPMPPVQPYPSAQAYPSAPQAYPSAQQAYPSATQAYPSAQQAYGQPGVVPATPPGPPMYAPPAAPPALAAPVPPAPPVSPPAPPVAPAVPLAASPAYAPPVPPVAPLVPPVASPVPPPVPSIVPPADPASTDG